MTVPTEEVMKHRRRNYRKTVDGVSAECVKKLLWPTLRYILAYWV